MAFSAVTERGSATEKVSDPSIAMSPSANLTVGKIVWILVVTDNAATTGGDSTNHDTLVDTDGNIWNKVYERTRTAGAANDGVTHSLWWARVATQIDTSDSITFTGDTNVTAKVIMCWEATVSAGNTVQIAGTPQFAEAAATNNPAALTISGLSSKEYLYIGVLAVEEEYTVWTESASDAFTNVFASEGVTSGPAGTVTSNVAGFVGYRIATGTGATFDVGAIGAADIAVALVAFEEVAVGGGAVEVQATPATLASAAQGATITPAAKTVSATSATVGAQAQAATVEAGSVTISASPASVSAQAQAATITPATKTIAASPATLASAAQAATVTGPDQPTRLYLGGLDTSPRFYVDPVSYGAQWENVANAPNSTRRLWRDHPGYGFHQISRSKSPASDTADRLMSILVSNPLAAQTISGTAKAVARVSENAAGSDLRSQMVIRVMSGDLQTERGVLYAGDDGALSVEWSTTVTNRYFPQSGSATLSSVDAQDGDRLLVELGYRSHAAGTSGSGTIDLGDDGTDLPDNESNTTQGAPWIEFSQTLVFKDFPHGINLLTEDFTGTNGDPWPTEWDTDAIGVDSAIDINTNAGRLKAGTASTSDSGRGILDAVTIDVADADMYLRFRFDSLEPVSGSASGAVVALIWLRADGTWRPGAGVNDRPVDNGVGFEWWNNRVGTKIVEVFGGTVFHPSTDFECAIRQPVDTSDTWVRLRLDGVYAAMKMWQGDKVDEPLDWQIETDAVQVTGTGQVQIVAKRDNSNGTVITSMFVDDFDIGDAGASVAPVEVLATPATLTVEAQAPTVAPSAKTVAASPATLATAAQVVTVTPAEKTIAATPATVTTQAPPASVSGAVAIAAQPAVVSVAAQPATVTRAATTINASPALLTAQAQALNVALGAKTVAATFAALAALAQPAILDLTVTHYQWAAGRPIDRNKAGPPRSRWATTRPRQ